METFEQSGMWNLAWRHLNNLACGTWHGDTAQTVWHVKPGLDINHKIPLLTV